MSADPRRGPTPASAVAGVWRMPRGIPGAAVLSGLATASGIALTALSGWLIVSASHRPQILTLMAAIVGVRAFGMARPALRYTERLRSHDAALADLAQRRVGAYEALVPLTPARLGAGSRADILTGAVDDLEDAVYAQVRVVVPVVGATVAGVLTVLACALFSFVAAGIVAASLLVTALIGWAGLAAERRAHADLLAARARVGAASALVTGRALDLQAIGATNHAIAALDAAHADLAAANRHRALARAAGMLATGLVTAGATALVAWHARGLVASGMPDAVAALLVLTPVAVADALAPLPDAMGAWARAAASGARLRGLLDRPAPLGDHGDGLADDGPVRVDATARWDAARPPVGPLRADLAPGEKVLVTGPNGTGKSTLLALLATWLDPDDGSVRVSGRDTRDLIVESLRARAAVLDDEPHVFATTLRENLRFARPDATDADLLAALRAAGLGGWAAGLPDGLDTRLGTDDRGVSGGERARLGLARAVLSRRPLLLLDEPVAHLDGPTADAVLRDVVAAAEGRTVVMVSHRDDVTDGFDRELRLPAPPPAAPPVDN